MKNYIPGQLIAVLRPTFLCAAPSVILWMLLAIIGICIAVRAGNSPAVMTLHALAGDHPKRSITVAA